MSTLAEIRQDLIDRLNLGTSDPFANPAKLARIINTSNLRLGRVADWPWLQAVGTVAVTTTGQFDLSTISRYRHTKLLSYEDTPMYRVTPMEGVLYRNTTPDLGRVYYIVGSTLYLWPNPSATQTLTHVYVVDEAPLTGDTSSPLLPSAYNELLVLQAAITVAMGKKDLPMAQALRTEHAQALKEATDEVHRTRQLIRISADETMWAV